MELVENYLERFRIKGRIMNDSSELPRRRHPPRRSEPTLANAREAKLYDDCSRVRCGDPSRTGTIFGRTDSKHGIRRLRLPGLLDCAVFPTWLPPPRNSAQ